MYALHMNEGLWPMWGIELEYVPYGIDIVKV